MHSHRTTASAEPTDDPIAEVLLPGNLFQEESNAVLKLLVRELGNIVVFDVGVNAICIEHLVPFRGGGHTKSERQQAKVRWAVFTLCGRQLRLHLLVILVPSISEKELHRLNIVGSQ